MTEIPATMRITTKGRALLGYLAILRQSQEPGGPTLRGERGPRLQAARIFRACRAWPTMQPADVEALLDPTDGPNCCDGHVAAYALLQEYARRARP